MNSAEVDVTDNIGASSDELKPIFDKHGYLVFRGLIDPARLAAHARELYDQFDRLSQAAPLFNGGGGMIMGHLNCFPGASSRFVYDTLQEKGLMDLLRKLWTRTLAEPNAGCNFNLPGSSAQNYHVDGYFDSSFPVVNIASVDTDLVNGALDVLEDTHRREYKYWQLVMEKPKSVRVPLRQGDVVLRTSVLWHRGMPNRSCRARPMLALSWEDGGNKGLDPYAKNGGEIAFYPNRYDTKLVGRLRERAYVLAPRLNEGVRFVQSLMK